MAAIQITKMPQEYVMAIIILVLLFLLWAILRELRISRQLGLQLDVMDRQIELRKIGLVESDLFLRKVHDMKISLPKEKEEEINKLERETYDLARELAGIYNEAEERMNRLELEIELKRIKEILKQIEEKEKELLGERL
ncbi:MAG: hypothetical protein ACE5K4_09825 [Candidatus Hydrothermarchaeota archaeon]